MAFMTLAACFASQTASIHTFAPDQFGQFDERPAGDTVPLASLGVPSSLRNAA